MSDSMCESVKNDSEDEVDIYTSYASYMSSSEPGSDNLLVTFDYGFQDSLEGERSLNSSLDHEFADYDNDSGVQKNLFNILEEESSEELAENKFRAIYSKSPNNFKVHQVLYEKDQINSDISMATSLVDYNIDTSGDYGSWAQSESDPEEDTTGCGNVKTYQNYHYEDLIKNEIHDDIDEKTVIKNDNGGDFLIKFNFDEDLPPPHWFSNNEQQLYYKSVDYLN